MKGYEDLSRFPTFGDGPMSIMDLEKMTVETASMKEAIPRSVKAVTILLTRIATIDACIDIMRRRDPFSKIDRPLEIMQRLLGELTAECLRVYEFCVADNVLAIQAFDKEDTNPEDPDYDDPETSEIESEDNAESDNIKESDN